MGSRVRERARLRLVSLIQSGAILASPASLMLRPCRYGTECMHDCLAYRPSPSVQARSVWLE
jgi:hypothetical protein